MKKNIAFLIIAHTDPEHLGRLTQKLLEIGDVYVHIDSKSKLQDFIKFCSTEVIFTTKRSRVIWGGYSQVDATANLIDEALSSKNQYSYYSLLSGLDYPIKPLCKFREMLLNSGNRQFINSTVVGKDTEHYWNLLRRPQYRGKIIGSDLFDRAVCKIINTMCGKIRRSVWFPEVPHFGSAYWSLTHSCVTYLSEQLKINKALIRHYKYTMASDEQIFHTIVFNSKYKNDCANPIYFGRGTYHYSNHHLFDPSHKVVFNENHFNLIKNSPEHFFFARKMQSRVSDSLITMIDDQLL